MNVKQFAELVSAVFHPLIMPVLGFVLLISFDASLSLAQRWLLLATAIFFSVLLLLLLFLWLQRRGAIDSLDIPERRQRLLPMIAGTVCYGLGFVALRWLEAPPLVQGLMFCYATNTLLVALITYWWKVSVHTTATAGPLTALWFQFGAPVLPLLLLVPIVGAARVILQRHTVAQVVVGALIGIGITALQLWFWFS
ncbi:hypothetical protein HC891_22285 [Candidatus Gracilibacteria bacterium]|nr:hypothetical protein [Candidatus Gracilibacteria bacterium]